MRYRKRKEGEKKKHVDAVEVRWYGDGGMGEGRGAECRKGVIKKQKYR